MAVGYRNFLIFRTRLADLFNLAIRVEVSKNVFTSCCYILFSLETDYETEWMELIEDIAGNPLGLILSSFPDYTHLSSAHFLLP